MILTHTTHKMTIIMLGSASSKTLSVISLNIQYYALETE
jgi:hypothetical protein